MQENNALHGFSGVIGRKRYLINSLALVFIFVLPILGLLGTTYELKAQPTLMDLFPASFLLVLYYVLNLMNITKRLRDIYGERFKELPCALLIAPITLIPPLSILLQVALCLKVGLRVKRPG